MAKCSKDKKKKMKRDKGHFSQYEAAKEADIAFTMRQDDIEGYAFTIATRMRNDGVQATAVDKESIMAWIEILLSLVEVYQKCSASQSLQKVAEERRLLTVLRARQAIRRSGEVRGRRKIAEAADVLLDEVGTTPEEVIEEVILSIDRI